MADIYEAVVVGGGAAGLSAALVLGRSCRRVLVLDDGRPRNAVAERMHGFLSRDGMPPHELLQIARAQLADYSGVELRRAHVTGVHRDPDGFTVTGEGGAAFRSSAVLLATGLYDALPEISGLPQRWGRSAFVCPYCDGWEVRDRRLAVVGKGRKAVELAQELRQWSEDLIVCGQGVDDLGDDHRRWLQGAGVPFHAAPAAAIEGGGTATSAIVLHDGTRIECGAVFLCAPLRQRHPLVDMLGCRLREDGEIEVDGRGRTSVPGCYAAGDAVTAVHQVVLAAASGVCAAMGINEDLLAREVREQIRNIP